MKKLYLGFFLVVGIIGLGSTIYLVQKPKKETPSQAAVPYSQINKGALQTVFNWQNQKCTNASDPDYPDTPARAFIDADGNTQLITGDYNNRRFIGTNLNNLNHECNIILGSDYDPLPRNYNDREWLISPYTLDGNTIYSLVHTEYHGWEHNNCNRPESAQKYRDCWWNSINLAISNNKGVSYSHATPPSHNILNSPLEYNPNNTQEVVGFLQPSNIVKKDNHYYFLVLVMNPPDQPKSCLARTANLADPKSWRLWNGSGFNLVGNRADCARLNGSPPNFYLGYNTYFQKYLAMDCYPEGGCYYNTSADLINWSNREYILTPGEYNLLAYGALLQPGDLTRNFEQTGRSPWLYFTDKDRNLKRVRIRFNNTGEENRFEFLDLQMNEKKGTQTLDASFYSHDATLNGNNSWFQEGPINALTISNGSLQVNHQTSLNAANQLTIEVNLRTSASITSGSYPVIIHKEADSKRNYGLYLTSPGVLHFSLSNTGGYAGSVSNKTINDGQWHKIMIIYDDNTGYATYYIDGIMDVQRYHGVKLANGINNGPVVIGTGFNGDLDYLTLYNYLRVTPPSVTVPPAPNNQIMLDSWSDQVYRLYKDTDFSATINGLNTRQSLNGARILAGQAMMDAYYYQKNNQQVDFNKAQSLLTTLLNKYPNWGKFWGSPVALNQISFTAWWLWPKLDKTIKDAFTNIMIEEADFWTWVLNEIKNNPNGQTIPQEAGRRPGKNNLSLITSPPSSSEHLYDTRGEENGWNAQFLATAYAMFPSLPQANSWNEAAKCFAFHTISKSETFCGITSRTIADDGTLGNHNLFPSPMYALATVNPLLQAQLSYRLAGLTPPSEFSHNLTNAISSPIWTKNITECIDQNFNITERCHAGQDWGDKNLLVSSFILMYWAKLDSYNATINAQVSSTLTTLLTYFYNTAKGVIRYPLANPVVSMENYDQEGDSLMWFKNIELHSQLSAKYFVLDNYRKAAFRQNYFPTALQTTTNLTFKLKFQGINASASNKTTQIIFKQDGVEKFRFESVILNSDSNGVYNGTVNNLSPGNYDLYFKAPGYLQKKFINVFLNSGINNQDFTASSLLAGDIAGGGVIADSPDNMVDATDLGKLISVFNPSGTVPNGTPADLNSDNRIDVSDLGLLISNYAPGVYGD